MAAPSQLASSPFHGKIKVYDTPDGSDVHWMQPRRAHLHKKTPSGATLCCPSVTLGGVIEDPDKSLFWMTCDQLVPKSEAEIEQHKDTSDEHCACIGIVEHTSRNLHYTLINILIDVRNTGPIKDGVDYISGYLSYRGALHPVLVKDQHRASDLIVMTRGRNGQVMTGRITSLPTRVARPAYMGTGELMVAKFDPAKGPVPSKIDAGTWVYVRKVGRNAGPESNGVRGVERFEDGVNYAGTFREGGGDNNDDHEGIRIPVIQLGHIVEVDESGDKNASVRVTIQGSYEVLTEIFIRQGKLNNPDGVERRPVVGTDTSSIST
ncbi:hypothetical protein F4805DRAFT_153939 [Annulohypoxylon moriforme]|nr:hypothetical protein F4805DRAFT_153939 [Annulohypoxylon moriforme]